MFLQKKRPSYAGSHASGQLYLSGVERYLPAGSTIVSKTDVHGLITYANDTFIDISAYAERELLGAPHSILRHPAMPRCVFKLLWDTVEQGQEIFAYVINRCKNGDHYWVLAHITPCYDAHNTIIGYHSNRRPARPEALAVIQPLYKELLDIEGRSERKEGMEVSTQALLKVLKSKKVSYAEFVFSL